MTTKKLINKVSRYIVLSKEFEQDVNDLFEDRAVDTQSMVITTTGTSLHINGSGSFLQIISQYKTRAEIEKAQ